MTKGWKHIPCLTSGGDSWWTGLFGGGGFGGGGQGQSSAALQMELYTALARDKDGVVDPTSLTPTAFLHKLQASGASDASTTQLGEKSKAIDVRGDGVVSHVTSATLATRRERRQVRHGVD